MHIVEVDSTTWRTGDDLWRSILSGLKAPEWHGRNLNALWDTVTERARYGMKDADCINDVQPPFTVIIINSDRLSEAHRAELIAIAKLLQEAKTEYGLDVSLTIQPGMSSSNTPRSVAGDHPVPLPLLTRDHAGPTGSP